MALPTTTVSWFSGGVSSAVATKLIIEQVDKIIYQHIDDQHEDTLRFVRDCEGWFGKPVEIMQHEYKCVDTCCRQMSFLNSPQGATCTKIMKRRFRKEWEESYRFFNEFRYVWGMDFSEDGRVEDLESAMPEMDHSNPLIDRGLTKADAHGILREAGIKRPKMYDLGYPNNNCVGCIKGGKGYWNKIRLDFPAVFKSRCKLERDIGATCLKKARPDLTQPASETNSVKLYLDELDPEAGRDCKMIIEECGAMCQAIVRPKAPTEKGAGEHDSKD